jgi:hypothetical protein
MHQRFVALEIDDAFLCPPSQAFGYLGQPFGPAGMVGTGQQCGNGQLRNRLRNQGIVGSNDDFRGACGERALANVYDHRFTRDRDQNLPG